MMCFLETAAVARSVRRPDEPPIDNDLLILRLDGPLYTANVRGANRRILAAVDAANPQTVVVDVSAAPVIPVTVLDEFADLQREFDARGVTLWVAALPPRALATARQLPGWGDADAAGRVFPTSPAAAKAYVDNT